MAMDLIARATATSARSDASQALARTATLDLFTNLPARSIDPGITTLMSGGYASGTAGAAAYVADGVATSALATAHPRFCKQSADGRYFRLSGDFITVEQAGATGVAGTNDQPAIQAAVTYANATGILMVRFTRPAYELWCPIRTTATGPGGANETDGYPILITKAVALVGLPGGSVLTFKNSIGGAKSTITQTTAWGPWQGGGIFVNANSPGTVANIRWVHFENLTLAGTTADWVAGNGGSNISDKGFGFYSNGNYGVDRLTMRNMTAHHFSGEIFYGGCFDANSAIIAENVELYHSQQCAWNPTGIGKVFATNLNAHTSYLASEIITGAGHTYVGCRFANAYNAGAIATQFYVGGYRYDYPNRNNAVAPKYVNYIDCTFENITVVTLSSWTRGRVVSLDTSWAVTSAARDIDLDIVHWADQRSVAVMAIGGPPTLTTQWFQCPVGVFYPATANIRIGIVCKRTSLGAANSRYSDGVTVQSGLIDAPSVQFTVAGEVRNAYTVSGTPPAGFAVPLITSRELSITGGQAFGGTYDSPAANVAYDVKWPAMVFYSSGAGPHSVTLTNTYGYADGQLATFYLGGGSTAKMTFAASGAGMKLPRARALAVTGDRLVLRWNRVLATWVEEVFWSAQPLLFTGSATYDAPSIAAGASTTTTITVTGCALGDYVSGISLGLSAAGLALSGYVSVANTVTVVIANLTGAAVDLASTTLSVEVARK